MVVKSTELEGRFVSRLQTLRKARGMTQADLAIHSGVSHHILANIESGRRRDVRLGEALAICRALDVPIDRMVADEPLTVAVEQIVL